MTAPVPAAPDDGETRENIPAIMPSAMARRRGTCADCYTWNGPRGSAHDPLQCPHRKRFIERMRYDIETARQRLADLTGEPS